MKKILKGFLGTCYIFGGFAFGTYATTMIDILNRNYGVSMTRTVILVIWATLSILLGLVLGMNLISTALFKADSQDK